MNIIIYVMTDGNEGISGQRQKNRMAIHRHMRCMGVQTAVDVSIKRNVYTNIMPKRMQRKIK